MSALNNPVLVLNAHWQPIGTCSVKKALEDMNSSKQPKRAIKTEYTKDDEGNYNFAMPTEVIPLFWAEWVTLAPRDFDPESIHTSKLEVRVPTVVIVGSNYSKMPVKTFRPTKRNIYNHYGGRCIWTGEIIPYGTATVEHMQPRSRGGDNSWSNLGLAAPEPNREKADRTPEEYGVKPKYKLSTPKPVPAHVLIKSAAHPDWNMWLNKTNGKH